MNGTFDGSGQLGFLQVTVEDATIDVTGVSVSFDLDEQTTHMLAFDELDASTLLLNGHPSASGGPLVLHAGVSASALLPGGAEPFSLGSADLTATWQDVNDPLNVNVQLTGGLTDFLSVRVQELLDVLQKLRDLTTQLDGSIPPDLQANLHVSRPVADLTCPPSAQ